MNWRGEGRAGAALSTVILLAGCQAAAPAPLPGPVEPTRTVYGCEDGRTVTATYQGQSAGLEIDGQGYVLRTALSGSGARYVGGGLQWWTKGEDDARLSRLAPGEQVAGDPGVICSTGTVAVAGKTPEAARQVVRRYFALLAAGETAKAAQLRSDAAAPPPLPGVRAELGASGSPEGAAGSLYVQVPVELQGGENLEQGRRWVLLRRVNDVDGATPDQLRWRIERIDTAPTP